MDINDASLEELSLALEKKKQEYLNYTYKYWIVFTKSAPIQGDLVLAKNSEEAIDNVKRFSSHKSLIGNDQFIAEIIDPATFNEKIAEAKSKWEYLESLKNQFKKKNDL